MRWEVTSMAETEKNILLRCEGICKQFSGVPVLKNVDLEVAAGEVHALMGENGAGKSTIIKIITGVYTKDAGTIYMDGKKVEINNHKDSINAGISVIYQELSLIPALSVTDNIFLGQEKKKAAFTQHRAQRKAVKELIDRYGFDVDPDSIVESLGMAQRQMVEILKALSNDAKLIIMDEPTASLSAAESEILFDTIMRLKAAGTSVLYISHRLDEVYRISDRLTVMRDGRNIGIVGKEDINPRTVVPMMIGHEIGEKKSYTPPVLHKERMLEVRDLCFKNMVKHVSFTAYGGEILGIGGLVGSGRTELVRCIFGAEKPTSGEICYNGKPLKASVKANVLNNFGLVPEDRRNQGFIPLLSVEKNVCITNYDRLGKGCFIGSHEETVLAEQVIKDYDVRPANRKMQVANMSGGNQQKVVLGKWLCRDLEVLLLDEPTAGVDIGVKDELYRYMRALADKGAIIIMVSSDLHELVNVSDRILVMHQHTMFEEFSHEDASSTNVLLAASGEHTKEGRAL